MSDEVGGEGATSFEDIEGGGLGEGEGVKDVSEQIESEDQLEDTHQKGQEKPEEEQKPDVAAEDNAIEMSDNFDGNAQDLDLTDKESSDEEDNDEEPDLDKQMGDLEGAEADREDEQQMGSDNEDNNEAKDKEDEFGPGAGAKSETELVAKEDNEDKSTGKDQDKQQQKGEEEDNSENKDDQQPNTQDVRDESEYNEEEKDAQYGEQPEKEEEEPMELPEDLNLDEDGGEEKDGEQKQEENPLDVDNIEGAKDIEEEEQKDNQEGEGDQEETMETGQEENSDQADQQEMDAEDEEKKGLAEEEEEEAGKDNDRQEGPPEGAPGFDPQLHPEEEPADPETEEKEKDGDDADMAKHAAQTQHESQAEQSDTAQDVAGESQNQQQERDGGGQAQSDQTEGHEGDQSTDVTSGSGKQQQQHHRRKPGQTDSERTLGSAEEKVNRNLKTMNETSQQEDKENEMEQPAESDVYEHIKDGSHHHDTQTLDAATDQQQQQQQVPQMEDAVSGDEDVEDEEMKPDDTQPSHEEVDIEKLSAAKLNKQKKEGEGEKIGEKEDGTEEAEKMDVDGEKVETNTVQRGNTSSFHTSMDVFQDRLSSDDITESLRQELQNKLDLWVQPKMTSAEEEAAAQQAWQQYESLTGNLSQELCEQLRLVLEPTQASKLRGDYRTGKRLNMRKVIPYIASQFRKDKIWLRRTKPSKRQYQVMLAVDDSSSMADNHSKQLAFESLAVVANALTLLEVGQLAICSFGETMEMLHPFGEQFTNRSGARLLQQFTFEQKKTKIAHMLDEVTATMMSARSWQSGMMGHPETSQLLMVLSDGRGMFLEGMEVVKATVRKARNANIFLVFVIIDNPENKDSILDIRVPIFKGAGQLAEIRPYMDHFPFPFYIILRDINSLPHTLSDALRQWFELVTAGDR